MADFLCVKTCGLFRQGRTYSFAKPTAQALSAARGGFLKRLNSGGPVKAVPVIGEGPAPLVIPKRQGRPRKEKPVATRLIGGLADAVVDLAD